MPDRQGVRGLGGLGAGVLLSCTRAPPLPSSHAPMLLRSRPNLRVDFIEFGRNGLEDAMQSRAYDRNGERSDNDPLQDCITSMIS